MGRDKDHLPGKLVNYDQDSVKPRKWWEFLNEVHKNGIPWLFGNRKLSEKSIGLVTLWLELYIHDTELTELLYISIETEPGIFMAN